MRAQPFCPGIVIDTDRADAGDDTSATLKTAAPILLPSLEHRSGAVAEHFRKKPILDRFSLEYMIGTP